MKKIRRISLLVLTLIATGAITTAFVDYNKESITKQMNLEEDGIVQSIFPPENNGRSTGVVIIQDVFGAKHVAQTPGDNNGSLLFEGQAVVFTTDARGEIESVKGKKGINAVNVK